jgi:hypothetical protein
MAPGDEKQIESLASTTDRSSAAMEIDSLTKSMSALRFMPASVAKRLNNNNDEAS